MKRVSILLDDTTVLNFPFLWQLFKRYYFLSLSAPIFIIAFSIYFYLSQNDVYSVSVGFKNVSTESDSPTSSIARLLGEQTKELSPMEIIDMVKSIDFQQQVAEEMYKKDSYLEVNLNPIGVKDLRSREFYFAHCRGSQECIENVLRNRVPYLYTVNVDPVFDNRFILSSKALDAETPKIVLREVRDTMLTQRMKAIKLRLSQQITLTNELIDQKKKELETLNVTSVLDERNFLESKVRELDSKIISSRSIYESYKQKLSYYDIKLKETEKTITSKNVSESERSRYKRIMGLKNKISQLTNDIRSLEQSPGTKSKQDVQIIGQLKKERDDSEEELKKLGGIKRYVKNVDQFIEKKDMSSDYDEFDYKVMKVQFKKIKDEYNDLLGKRDRLQVELRNVNKKIEETAPSYEYLKKLEAKIIQLKLIESTLVADIVFDKHFSALSKYKRTSKGKIILFSSLLSIFILITVIFIRYMFDNKIYDEYELKKNFEELDIIGNAPDFR